MADPKKSKRNDTSMGRGNVALLRKRGVAVGPLDRTGKMRTIDLKDAIRRVREDASSKGAVTGRASLARHNKSERAADSASGPKTAVKVVRGREVTTATGRGGALDHRGRKPAVSRSPFESRTKETPRKVTTRHQKNPELSAANRAKPDGNIGKKRGKLKGRRPRTGGIVKGF